jgi:hypothetical protein
MDLARELVYGDSVDLPDGGSMRLKVVEDDCVSWDDWAVDLYGQVCHVDEVRRDNSWGREQRPLWADGAARKIWAGRECYWWQPADDLKSDPAMVKATAKTVRDLLEFGWQVIIVEVLDEGTDAYGSPIVRDVTSLGGVEWVAMTYEDRAVMVADMLADMGVMVTA